MAITLPDETRTELVAALKWYFSDERDEDLGDLQASFMLDFVLKEIGPSIYNQAINDAQAVLSRAVADLDLTLYEPECGHTAAVRTRRNRGSD